MRAVKFIRSLRGSESSYTPAEAEAEQAKSDAPVEQVKKKKNEEEDTSPDEHPFSKVGKSIFYRESPTQSVRDSVFGCQDEKWMGGSPRTRAKPSARSNAKSLDAFKVKDLPTPEEVPEPSELDAQAGGDQNEAFSNAEVAASSKNDDKKVVIRPKQRKRTKGKGKGSGSQVQVVRKEGTEEDGQNSSAYSVIRVVSDRIPSLPSKTKPVKECDESSTEAPDYKVPIVSGSDSGSADDSGVEDECSEGVRESDYANVLVEQPISGSRSSAEKADLAFCQESEKDPEMASAGSEKGGDVLVMIKNELYWSYAKIKQEVEEKTKSDSSERETGDTEKHKGNIYATVDKGEKHGSKEMKAVEFFRAVGAIDDETNKEEESKIKTEGLGVLNANSSSDTHGAATNQPLETGLTHSGEKNTQEVTSGDGVVSDDKQQKQAEEKTSEVVEGESNEDMYANMSTIKHHESRRSKTSDTSESVEGSATENKGNETNVEVSEQADVTDTNDEIQTNIISVEAQVEGEVTVRDGEETDVIKPVCETEKTVQARELEEEAHNTAMGGSPRKSENIEPSTERREEEEEEDRREETLTRSEDVAGSDVTTCVSGEPDVDMFEEERDLTDARANCGRHASDQHAHFIPVRDFGLKHLPEEVRHPSIVHYIRVRIPLTARVISTQTSSARIENDPLRHLTKSHTKRTATGFVVHVGTKSCRDFFKKPYTCPMASQQGEDHEVFLACVQTSRLAVFDDEEVENTMVEFQFHAENREGVVIAQGVRGSTSINTSNECVTFACFTHHRGLFDLLSKGLEHTMPSWQQIPSSIRETWSSLCTVISHPHGGPKSISVGRKQAVTSEDRAIASAQRENPEAQKVMTYTTATCAGCTGAPVFTGESDEQTQSIDQFIKQLDLISFEDTLEKRHDTVSGCRYVHTRYRSSEGVGLAVLGTVDIDCFSLP